jgi:anaerobic selenocysteine-containing dehydrogenase
MKYRNDKRAEPLIRELYRKEGGIMRAEKALSKVDRDYIKYVREMDAWKNKFERSMFQYNTGKADANLETARKALAEGLSPEMVQKITGLDPQAIEKLR